MNGIKNLICVLLVVGVLASPVSAQSTNLRTNEPTNLILPNKISNLIESPETSGRYIVQLMTPSLVAYDGEIPSIQKAPADQQGKIIFNLSATSTYLNYVNSEIDRVILQASNVVSRDIADKIDYRYDVIFSGFAAEMTEAEAAAIAQLENVKAVYPDYVLWPDTDLTPPWLGTTGLWNGANVPATCQPLPMTKGEGVLVGILDTGINMDHPSFAAIGPVDGFVHTNPFGTGVYKGLCASNSDNYVCNNKLVGVYSYITTPGALLGEDDSSHGSHTASTAAGNTINAEYNGSSVTLSGMAPHANIIAYDVCEPTGCPASASLAAVQQAIRDGVDVINFSLGPKSGPCKNPFTDPVELAFLEFSKGGGVVTTSAGNSGPSPMTTWKGSPWVITVANTAYGRTADNFIDPQSADILSQTSSRGPFTLFDVLEPELAAPGTNVLAACSTSNPTAPYGVVDQGKPVEVIMKSGTSMASPHVAGNAALMRALFPTWSGMEIKSALMMTALAETTRDYDLSSSIDAFDYGNGRLDMTRAALSGLVMNETYAKLLSANPALGGDVKTLNIPSYQNSQCAGTCSFTRTFRSVSNVAATYTATVEACTSTGMAVIVEPATFTIPAGGTQSVRFTVDASRLLAEKFAFGRVSFKTSSTFSSGEPISPVAIPFMVKSNSSTALFDTFIPMITN